MIQKVADIHASGKEGDILVFMTGQEDINGVITGLKKLNLSGLTAIPVYAALPTEEQQKIFERHDGLRKVVVATNIAETSLTANASNTIYVIVVGTSTGAKSVTMTSDRLAPTLAPTQVTVAGTCADVTVANVVINGTALPVTAGAYTGTVTTGMDTITIVATNASSQSVTRTVKVQ
jgi:hypothetical protein